MKYQLSILLICASLSSCVTLPETGQKKFLLTSVEDENKLGSDGYKEVLAKSKLANKSPNYAVLQRVGSRIASATGIKDFQWEYNLIESKELNAWCMPGGKIAVYTGILPYMKNEAGMAAVLGHEVAHATLRHAGQRMSEEMGTQIGLGLIGGTVFGNSQYKDQIMGAMGVGAGLAITLPFSRTHETEADTVGLRYMAEAGYDPREALEFWKRFSAETAGGAPPEFLSTHPGGPTRIKNIQKNMGSALKIYKQAPQQSGAGVTL